MPLIVLFIALAFHQLGIIGALWCYPAVIAFYFMLPERPAWMANLLLLLVVIPSAWYLLSPAIAARVTVTLIISTLFAAIFVRVFTRQQARLERSEKKRREGMAGISHELRTPLATLNAQVDAMLDGIRPTDRSQLLVLSRSLEHINALVDDLYLLALADVEALVCRRERVRWDLIIVIYGSGSVASAAVTDIEVVCVDGLFNVVDTNQTDCYNSTTGVARSCTGAGEDAEHDGLQPSYTRYSVVDGEEVVLDDNTGLMWQASSDTDGVSGLDDNDKMTQSEAITYCEALDYGSYSDWRVPTIKEFYSIYLMSGMDLSGEPGALNNGTTVDHSGVEPFIDTAYFDVGYGDTSAGERAIDGQYVTSTDNLDQVMAGTGAGGQDAFFGLNFVDGHLKAYERTANEVSDARYYVRCVRGNPDYGSNDFADNSDGTVSDNATKLMWQQDDSHSDDFDDAMAICAASTTGGHSDWRLPNLKKLHSIVDYNNAPGITGNPAIDTTYFNSTSFTNEAGQTPDYGYYWSSTALLSSSGNGNSGAYITFGRGLGYMENIVVDAHGAGAQRADNKTDVALSSLTAVDITGANCTFGDTAYSSGPQGDIKRIVNNYVRCVRDELPVYGP